MNRYFVVSYDSEGSNPAQEEVQFPSDRAARDFAGRVAKRRGGPVDLARDWEGDWAGRYMTTASPSEHHLAGYRFEAIES